MGDDNDVDMDAAPAPVPAAPATVPAAGIGAQDAGGWGALAMTSGATSVACTRGMKQNSMKHSPPRRSRARTRLRHARLHIFSSAHSGNPPRPPPCERSIYCDSLPPIWDSSGIFFSIFFSQHFVGVFVVRGVPARGSAHLRHGKKERATTTTSGPI